MNLLPAVNFYPIFCSLLSLSRWAHPSPGVCGATQRSQRPAGRVTAVAVFLTFLRQVDEHTRMEVLKLVCQQFTAEEIGERLFISPATVNGHRNNLLQKTQSRNVTGLVRYAIKNGIVEVF